MYNYIYYIYIYIYIYIDKSLQQKPHSLEACWSWEKSLQIKSYCFGVAFSE